MFLDRFKRRFKRPRNVILLRVDPGRCTGCGACIAKCKKGVFGIEPIEGKAIVANVTSCVGCGKCVDKMCRYGAIELKTEYRDE